MLDTQVTSHGGSSPSSPPRQMCRTVVHESVDNSFEAVCDVIHDMLQMKYGLVLDLGDMLRKVESKCGRHFREHAEVITPPAVIARLNDMTSMQFRTSEGHGLVSLSVECLHLTSFPQMLREVRKLHGTARIVAVVTGLPPTHPNGSHRSVMTSRSLTALAAFREDYAQSDAVVGRRIVNGNAPLFTFDSTCFCEAFVLDPEVSHVFSFALDSHELLEKSPPPMREEYKNLRSRLLPDEDVTTAHQSNSRNTSSARVPLMLDALATLASSELQSPIDGDRRHKTESLSSTQQTIQTQVSMALPPPPPTPQFMANLRALLEDPQEATRGNQQVFDMMQQLCAWLDKGASAGPHTVNEASKALDTVGLQYGLAACLKRAATPGNCSPHDLAMGLQAARCTGLAIRNSTLSPSFKSSFSNAGCVPALCDLLERWPDHEDMQRTAVFALRHIVEDEAAAIEALFIGAARVITVTAQRFPNMADIQTNSQQAIELMTLHRKAWIERREEQRSRSTSPISRTHSPRPVERPPFWQMQVPNLFSLALPSNSPFPPQGFATTPLTSSFPFGASPAPSLMDSRIIASGPEIYSHRGVPWR